MGPKSNIKLQEEFYQQIREDYPDLTLEQVKDICNSPWLFLKRKMESGDLPTMRLKYFGTFQVYQGRAKNMLNSLNKRFKDNTIDHKQYFKLKKMIEKFLDENKD